jgi:endonuclease I
VYAHYSVPEGYYADAADKSGSALKEALHDIITDHTVKSYDDARTILQVLDVDPDATGNVLLVYSGYSVNGAWDSGATWNREHLWPQSRGVSDGPGRSDLFALRPCDPGVNSSRGNKWFDISDENDQSYTFPARADAPECSYDSDSWQPRSSEQGDIARALFYMDTRYEHLSLTNVITTSTQMGTLSALIQWHLDDPVDEAERLRNQLIFTEYQHNRNPYIDDEEYVMLVYGMPEPGGIVGCVCVILFFYRKNA